MSDTLGESYNVVGVKGLHAAASLLQGPISNNGLCLLSLDGGGVRGLSTLMILRYLMAKINSTLPPSQRKKPFEVFDMIGGTSTGGLIAIMLGRLKMDVQECIDLYNSMFQDIFGSPIHKFPITVAFQIQSQFDSSILRRCITQIVGRSKSLGGSDVEALAKAVSSKGSQKAKDALIAGVAAKVLLDDGVARGCHTFVCATTVEDQRTVRFRDYPRVDLGIPSNISIVDAACATSAATSYFDAVNVNGRLYRDGGFGANNPVTEVWHEAREVWIKDDYEIQLDDLLKCFVSIGTGFPKTEGMKEGVKEFIDTLKNMVTQTKRTADDFMRSHRNLTKMDGSQRYFRFNVEQGLQDVGLEEWKKAHTIETVTEGYMESPERENLVALCANNLRMKTLNAQLDFGDEVKNYRALIEREQVRLRIEAASTPLGDTSTGGAPVKLTPEVLIAWLKPDLSYLNSHLYIRNKELHNQTGQWVFEDINFKRWRKNMGSRLWLHGKVGSGKTILCHSIIELLKAQVEGEDGCSCPVLFFYFSFNNSDQQTLNSFLITMIYQICATHGIPDPLQALYTKFRDMVPGRPTVPLPPRKYLELVFSTIIQSLSDGGYLIVDAMDEIPHGNQRDQFLKWLRGFSHQDNTKLSILASSQGEPDFSNEFRWDLGWIILGMRPSRVDVEIGFFIHHELTTAPKFSDLSEVNRDKIKNHLVSNSNGSFRWVDVILQMLRIPRVLRPNQIEEILHSLPKDLTESYDRLLERVDKAVSRDVAVALEWLSLARRPLFIEEVIEGAMVDPYKRPSYNSERQLSATDLLSCLTGLVTIEPQLPVTKEIRVETHVLILAHSSVRDYLLSENGLSTPIFRQYHFNSRTAHEFIARSCVEYLEHCGLVSWTKNHYPLAKYSRQYWRQHAGHVPGLLSVLESLSRKVWSPILYPRVGKIPMLRANDLNKTGEDFANVSGLLTYAPLESSNSSAFNKYPYSPLEPKQQCRVVVLLSSNHWKDPLECRMETVSLLDLPYYWALSFLWGDASNARSIVVDGFFIRIPANLEIALRYLRQAHKGYHQVFWIDAISINHDDVAERGHQLSMMSSIFKNARKVVAWLGPDDETSDIAMKFLEKFETIPDTPESVKNGLLSMPEATWVAIQELFHRPWFFRVWIISEVAIAKEIDVFCGTRNIPWSILERIEAAYTEYRPEIQQYTFELHMRHLDSGESGAVSFPERYFTRTILGSDGLTALVAIRRGLKRGRPYSMLEALDMTRNFKASDPRDRIYSLLMLFVGEDIQKKFLVDYSLSTTEIYLRFAQSWLASAQDLDLLSYSNTSTSDSQLPSWVPDWNYNTRTSSLDAGYGSRPFAKQPQRFYNATLGSSNSLGFASFGESRRLPLSGIRIGYINHLGNSPSRGTSPIIDQLIEWKRLMDVPHVIERYKRKLRNDVFIRTVLADQDFDIFAGSTRLKPRMKEIPNNKMYQTLQEYSLALQHSLEDRTFMVTDEGYVGLCPEHAEAGDEVFLLHGGRMPYILRLQYPARQQSIRYRLIGEAYVHGIMDGELVSKTPKLLNLFKEEPKVEEITLI